jgi:hypothetical protein
MGENVTLLGDIADDFDSQLSDAEKALNQYVESKNFSTSSMAIASTTIAFMRFGQTFVDMLRLGNGLRQGGWRGIGTDTIRLVNVAGVAGATVSRLSRILVLTQQAGTYTCTWITTANALRRTGQRFFASIEQLAGASGVDLAAIAKSGGTTIKQIKDLIDALKKMGVAIDPVKTASLKVDSLVDLLNARPSGALAFGIKYESGGRALGHQLFATYGRIGGLTITDTSGTLYRSVAALSKAYPNATIVSESCFFLRNTAIVSGAENVARAGGLAHLVVELLPVALKGTELPSQPKMRPPR